MGRKKNTGSLLVSLIGSLLSLVFAILRLVLSIVAALLSLVAGVARGSGGTSKAGNKPTSRPSKTDYQDKWDGHTLAAAPGADHPGRPRRGKNPLPGYDEAPCTNCGNGIGPAPSAFRERGSRSRVAQLWCGRCFSTIRGDRYYSVNADLTILGLPPDSLLRSHLPRYDTPPKPYSGSGCSKCGKPFKAQYWERLWLPTNEIIRLCPGCDSRALDHVGWRAQLGELRNLRS